MKWFNRFMGRSAPPSADAQGVPAQEFDATSATLDELIAENQRLDREQNVIKDRRRVIAAIIDTKLKGN